MKKIFQSAYEVLKQGSDTNLKHIVFTDTNMLVISSHAILYYDYEAKGIVNTEYLRGKYLSFEDLSELLKIKFESIIPEKEGFLIDYHKTFKYSGSHTETSYSQDAQFFVNVSEKGIYKYEVKGYTVLVPVGYALHLLSEYKSGKTWVSCRNWNLNIKLFSAISKAITQSLKTNKSIAMDFFEVKTGKKETTTHLFISENADEYWNTNTCAILSHQIDHRTKTSA